MLARAWAGRAIIRANSDDADGSLRDLKSILTMARHLESDPTFFGQLVSASLRTTGFEAVERIMDDTDIPYEKWTQLEISRRGDPRKLLRVAYKMESARGLTTLVKSAKGQVVSNESMDELPFHNSKIALLYRVFFADDDAESFMTNMNTIDLIILKPFDQWKTAMDGDTDIAMRVNSGVLTRRLLPILGSARKAVLTGETRCRLAEIAIAMKGYFQKHQVYPKTLAQLSPQFLKQTPLDPFSGQALKIINRDGNIILYSVGDDGIDDQGRPVNYEVRPFVGDEIFILPAKPSKPADSAK